MPDDTAGAPPHPLLYSVQRLVEDMFSTLIFVGLYAATGNVSAAVGAAIVLGLARIAWLKHRSAPVDSLQWLSLFLVVVFGGAALITRNPVFVMLKPTLIYTAVGAVMLKPGWMNRYAPPIVLARGADVTATFGYVWAGLMFVTAGANLAVALLAGPVGWAWFIGVFPVASKIALFAIQYAVTRTVIRRRIRKDRELALSAA